ncbi:hypothetical protein TW85_18840 [Marinomonas sp. S3726]|uniref:AraC family transcriptional regulator n=1 Tax=Marinomonas sp. S3726 TaxID=579484 RepID=UPI0005FA0547|nr:AraC family transcriptional regulator [Marinomonas sp. S3726]KJZ10790.1 hypothetical protein TW85_18840 [Marinomonas sp. S3726]
MQKYENTVSSASVLSLMESAATLSFFSEDEYILNKEDFVNTEGRSNEQILIDLWQYLDRSAQTKGYGLLLGAYINPAFKGLLASLVSQCETIREALENYIQHLDWVSSSEHWEMKTQADLIELHFTVDESKGYPNALIEKNLSSLVHWARKLSRQDVQLVTAEFTFAEPDYVDMYPATFGDSIHFSASSNMICFDKSILERKVVSFNPYLKELLESRIVNAKTSYKEESNLKVINKETVEGLILDLLPIKKANIDEVCHQLFVSRQTLYRHLQKENTSFKEILNQVRKRQSAKLLANSEISILEISDILGYTEVSSFYTAFNKWYDLSVSQFRRRLTHSKV